MDGDNNKGKQRKSSLPHFDIIHCNFKYQTKNRLAINKLHKFQAFSVSVTHLNINQWLFLFCYFTVVLTTCTCASELTFNENNT